MLPQQNRLRHRLDFQRMRREGRKAVFRLAVIIYRPNGLLSSRFAFTASRKIGNAVQRNRARRLMREAVRKKLDQSPAGFDFLFVARRNMPSVTLSEANELVDEVFERICRLNAPTPPQQIHHKGEGGS